MGKEVVKRAIPNEEACDALVELIKEYGVHPAPTSAPSLLRARPQRDLGDASVAGMWKDPDPDEEEAEELVAAA